MILHTFLLVMCAACEHSCALRLSLLAHVQANTLKKRFVCAATWSSHVCVAVFVRQHRCVRLLCARSELQVLQLVVSPHSVPALTDRPLVPCAFLLMTASYRRLYSIKGPVRLDNTIVLLYFSYTLGRKPAAQLSFIFLLYLF